MNPVTDIIYSNLSTMDMSTLTRNLVAITKDRQTVQNDATLLYNFIHETNDYFDFDVNKRENVKKKEEEIWYKFKEYLSITKQLKEYLSITKQLNIDVPLKLLLELLELYVDNGIIKFKKIYAEEVLKNLQIVVAIEYIKKFSTIS